MGLQAPSFLKKKPKRRMPIPTNNPRKIQAKCVSTIDDMLWLIAPISNSDMRLAEADRRLEADIPFI